MSTPIHKTPDGLFMPKECKQQLDEVRTLAIKLFDAGQRQKRKHGSEIWGESINQTWRDLPSESVEFWDAMATYVHQQLKG